MGPSGDAYAAGNGAPAAVPGPQIAGSSGGEQPKEASTPVYKKWWFWVIVGVSAYVVYSFASDDGDSAQTGREGRQVVPFDRNVPTPTSSGGLILLSF